MNEMTLPSPETGFEIRAQAVTSRAHYLSVTETPHNIESFTNARGRNFSSLKLEGLCGVRTRDLRLSKQAALPTAPGLCPFGC